jgi:hypothetical protein
LKRILLGFSVCAYLATSACGGGGESPPADPNGGSAGEATGASGEGGSDIPDPGGGGNAGTDSPAGGQGGSGTGGTGSTEPDAGGANPSAEALILSVSPGGANMSSENFRLVLTGGQQPGGNVTATSTNFALRTGFVGGASD